MDTQKLLIVLKERFQMHQYRHPDLSWHNIESQIEEDMLTGLKYMEETGGEPDILIYKDSIYFVDFAKESPKRRSLCLDQKARESRKQNPPCSSVEEDTKSHHLLLLTEDEYIYLQEIEEMDLKTTSWIASSESIRQQGGALFGSKRYGRVFIYCNGADSYYSSRGYRAKILVGKQN